MGRR
jgi:cobalamin biosynthesis protein CobT